MISLSAPCVDLDWVGAAAWFATLPSPSTADAALRHLAGLAVCAITCDDPAIAAAWRRAHAVVNERAGSLPSDPFPACDPYLVVFAAAAARREQLPSNGFRGALERLAEQLRIRRESLRQPRVHAVAVMLRALGEDVPLDDSKLAAWTPPSLEALFDADEAQLAKLAHWITLHPRGDRVRQALTRVGDPRDVIDALVAIAAAECRAYRLTTVCDLVRTLQAAGDASAELGEVRNFLALQQRTDGAFGLRNPFVRAETANDAVRFHLPISLATVWAFAEQHCGRSLIAHVTAS
jgi:hypothetical protein